jgi:hypothetical protein
LAFVDGCSLPIVANNDGRVRMWPFAGGLVSASLAQALTLPGLTPAQWDDFSVSVRATSTDTVARAIAELDPADVRPALPEDMAAALKFSVCLPNSIATAVLGARMAAPDTVAEILSRPTRQLRV